MLSRKEVRDIALRAAELHMIAANLGNTISLCLDRQKELGPGVLALKMQKAEFGAPSYWWKDPDTIPDAALTRMAKQADIRRGIMTIFLVYADNSRLSAYVLNLNTSPSWREFTRLPFAVTAELAESPLAPDKRQASPLRVRAEDMEQSEDFL